MPVQNSAIFQKPTSYGILLNEFDDADLAIKFAPSPRVIAEIRQNLTKLISRKNGGVGAFFKSLCERK